MANKDMAIAKAYIAKEVEGNRLKPDSFNTPLEPAIVSHAGSNWRIRLQDGRILYPIIEPTPKAKNKKANSSADAPKATAEG